MRLGSLLVATGALLIAALPASAEVHLRLANGRATLSATSATPSQILSEWARVGHTTIVNAERATGAPLTIELADIPEAQALDIILRGVSGYILAPRADIVPAASQYDRIFIAVVTTPARPAPPVAPPPAAPPAAPNVQPPAPEPVAPPANPQAAPVAPTPRIAPPTSGGVPAGVAAPGMMAPTPQPPPQTPGSAPASPQ
ncbi:MAG: hypothetical protein LBQ09_08620 [Acidobacteriaceae bacterium]|jgi:hypothetical protein|nr:hypothetical protein [Acidobacteriaceae bacterium]